MVDAATAPVKQAQTTYDQQAQQQQGNVTGLTQALASILQGIAPGVQKTYDDASTRQAAFAKGFSDQMQQHLGENASSTSSFLQNIVGAPSSQIAATSAKVAPQAAGDTLYGLRGYIPASTLNEEGAAYTANAQQLPGIAQSQGLQQIGKIQAAQRAQDASFAQQIGSEAGKAPQYQRQLTNDAANQAYKDAQLGISQGRLTLQQQMDSFNQRATKARINLQGQSLQLQATKFARSVLQSDRSYGIALAGLGLRQAAAQRAATAAEYKYRNGGYSPQQINKFNSILQQGVDAVTIGKDANGQATFMATDPNPKNKAGWTKVGNVWQRPVTYGDFVTQSVAHGAPLSLAIDRANKLFPDYLRPDPKILAQLIGVPTSTAASVTGQKTGVGQSVAGGFVPRGVKVTVGRSDQGRDIQTVPGTPIVAPGAGIVIGVKSDPGGGGKHFGTSYPVVRFTSGPYKGMTMYIGHTTTQLRPGQKFKAGDAISFTGSGGPETGGAPPGWAEIGFAPGGTPGSFGQQPPF